MSDMQEFSAFKAEESIERRLTPPLKSQEVKEKESFEKKSYFPGDLPQSHLYDPQAILPLNSDWLVGSALEKISQEINALLQEEISQIQRLQKKIEAWEEEIEKNKEIVQKNQNEIGQNLLDISHTKKNRDYWLSLSEEVLLDYTFAGASLRESDWQWLIKKYGLKNKEGTAIDLKSGSLKEICQNASSDLAFEYKAVGNKYEMVKREKEMRSIQIIQENSQLLKTNEQLQEFISVLYDNEIESLQDGVLLLKEFGVKLKKLSLDKVHTTYGDLRAWAELFLDPFLRENSKVPQKIVTEFRRFASIPLPPKNS